VEEDDDDRHTNRVVAAVVVALRIIGDEIRGCRSWQQYNRTDREEEEEMSRHHPRTSF